jgi:hypothetical protein
MAGPLFRGRDWSGSSFEIFRGVRVRVDRILDYLREQLAQWGMIARGYAERAESRLVGAVCDATPREILAAVGIVALRVPILDVEACTGASHGNRIADALRICEHVIVPRGCAAYGKVSGSNSDRIVPFVVPHGYGEDAAIELHHSLDSLIKRLGRGGIDRLDPGRLALAVSEHDTVRRLTRGIASVRHSRRNALSQSDLMLIFEAAAALPPDVIIESLAGILDALNSLPPDGLVPPGRNILVRGGHITRLEALDDMERAGCVIGEDDSCNGRRQFDVSHNHTSPGLYYEMLNALSYRPLCPSLRPPRERFDLFYRDLKNYAIETVVFLRDTMDEVMIAELESLRIRLMRTGVDPVIVDSVKAGNALSAYLAATGTLSP